MDHKRKKEKRRSQSSSPERERKRNKSKKTKHRSPSESDDSSHGMHHKKRKHKHKSKSRSRSRERKSSKNIVPDRPLTVDEMERLKAQTKRDKEMQKALETPEEKRARRLAKKEAKLRKHKEEMGWDAEYMGYTNADNPFGDEHLHDTFVWNKKREKEGLKDVPRSTLELMQKQKTIENKIELEKVKKRRLEREREREEREHEREAEQRDKESEYYRVWETQEDNFHLNQAKLRSTIRIEDGRAKPIDLLAKYISAEDDDLTLEMHEPYTYLNGLTIEDLEDLLEDIKVYREMEQGKNADYWRDITIITEDELTTLRKIDPSAAGFAGERRSGINTSVSEDVVSVFKGKSLSQLALLGQQIEKKLSSGQGIDVGYWESLRQQLLAHMARTRLREKHGEQLRRRLFKLKEEQGISETKPLFPIAHEPSTSSSQSAVTTTTRAQSPQVEPDSTTPDPGTPIKQEAEPGPSVKEEPGTSDVKEEEPGTSTQDDEGEGVKEEEEEAAEEEEESLITEEDLTSQQYDDYIQGCYSPKLLRPSELEPDTIVYDPEDDIRRLEYARVRMQRIGKAKEETDREFEKLAREGMNNDEAQFSVEVPLEKQVLLWSDKYRPRKPRFFNRVHTGFEWNKYNQTHYDIDNPPPKIVQGYKFNIFYPDLIDKTKTPEYFLTPCPDNTDFAILRFHTGPPYEDIAFKIVNREWEYSYKRGFRCQFHNNIFQLWYHFKRYRYRR